MRENMTSGDVPFRKAYIQSVVDRIEVDDDFIRNRRRQIHSRTSDRRKCRIGARCWQMCTEVVLPRGIEPLFSP